MGLFNFSQFNTTQLNVKYNTNIVATVDGGIVFNNFLLNDPTNGVYSSVIPDEGMPTRDFQTFPNPNTHGEGLLLDFFRRKDILVRGHIMKETAAQLQTYIKSFKAALRPRFKELKITKGGFTRQYIATVTNSVFSRIESVNIDHIPFEVNFTSISPFASDINFTSNDIETVTDSEFITSIENSGNVETYLTLILTFNSVTNVTEVEIENQTTGEILNIQRNFSAAEVIKVDGEVTVNANGTLTGYDVFLVNTGNTLKFSGTIPKLDVGVNSIKVTVTSTAHEYELTLKTKMKYS